MTPLMRPKHRSEQTLTATGKYSLLGSRHSATDALKQESCTWPSSSPAKDPTAQQPQPSVKGALAVRVA